MGRNGALLSSFITEKSASPYGGALFLKKFVINATKTAFFATYITER
jgi:hypothetical protein